MVVRIECLRRYINSGIKFMNNLENVQSINNPLMKLADIMLQQKTAQ
jgi:hypothetical protein